MTKDELWGSFSQLFLRYGKWFDVHFLCIFMYIVPCTQNNNYRQNEIEKLAGEFPHKRIQAIGPKINMLESIKTLMNVMCDSFKSIDS